MSKLKKAVLIVFTLLFVMNLQINTSLTKGMNGDFSLAQLVENVFFSSTLAAPEDPWYEHPCPNGTGSRCLRTPSNVGCIEYYSACDEN